VNPNANTINAAAQVDDPGSVFSFYRKVIALRHSDPVVAYGDFRMLLPDDEHVYAFKRSLPEAELLVLANFSGTGRTAGVGDGGWADRGTAELVLGNYPPDAGERHPFDLRPWEVKVFRRKAQ
jgi:oligo-1,6-glucosidase